MTNITSIAEAHAQAKEAKPAWPDPSPLPSTLPPVPNLDPRLMPSQLRPWVEDIAERVNVPLDYAAIPAMVAVGSLVGAKVGVRPQANTPWTEAGNLWGVVVAKPGAGKSPVVGEVLAPLRRLDAQADKANQIERSYYEDQMAVYKLAQEVAQKRARKAVQEGDLLTAQDIIAEAIEPTPPAEKRYVLTDATVEALGEICAANPNGVLYYRDELLTLLKDLDSEEKAPARGFLMTGWTGKDFYSFDRITRGKVRIPRVNISLIGTTQPARLAQYIRSSLNDRNDGMCQRLQMLCWADTTSDWCNMDRPANLDARDAAYACFDHLAGLNPEAIGASRDPFDDGNGMPFLRFDGDGVERFVEYRTWLEQAIRSDEMPGPLVDHLSKYRGLTARLALICHLASGGVGPVTGDAVATAIEWVKYLEGHARRAYGSLAIDSGEAAKAILRRIERGDLRDGFTERDIYKKNWGNLGKGKRLSDALAMLVDYDWLSVHLQATGGRPTTTYAINPKVSGAIALAA